MSLSVEVEQALIDSIAEGTLVVAWYPDASWQQASSFLSCSGS